MTPPILSTKAGRLEARFAALKKAGRPGLVTFITGGDPDLETSFSILKGLPDAGADIIEIGMPFSDPMADGPAIQDAGLRALAAGTTVIRLLDMVRRFRLEDTETPVVLMGYFNPVLNHGVDRFLKDALAAGVDGLIIVDTPPEEDGELCIPAMKAGLRFIRLATPTTDDARLPKVLANTSGFVYYVSIAGITGTAAPDANMVGRALERLRRHTDLPVAVGFGISTPAQAAEMAKVADAVVVGSALVKIVKANLDADGKPGAKLVSSVLSFVTELSDAVSAVPATSKNVSERTAG